MLGYGVMASNRIKSGLQVTESDGSSASNHSTVLYLDPVRAAPRGHQPPWGAPDVALESSILCENALSGAHFECSDQTKALTIPAQTVLGSGQGNPRVLGTFSPNSYPHLTQKSEGLGRSWKTKSKRHQETRGMAFLLPNWVRVDQSPTE